MVWKQLLELQNVRQHRHYFMPPRNNRPKQPSPGITHRGCVHTRQETQQCSKRPASYGISVPPENLSDTEKWHRRAVNSPKIPRPTGIHDWACPARSRKSLPGPPTPGFSLTRVWPDSPCTGWHLLNLKQCLKSSFWRLRTAFLPGRVPSRHPP